MWKYFGAMAYESRGNGERGMHGSNEWRARRRTARCLSMISHRRKFEW